MSVPTSAVADGPRVVSGLGSVSGLGPLLRELGATRVLIVTDQGLRRTGIVDAVAASIDGPGLAVAVHSDIPPTPRPRPSTSPPRSRGAGAPTIS